MSDFRKIKIACTAEEQRDIIKALICGNGLCIIDLPCPEHGNCRQCLEENIEWDVVPDDDKLDENTQKHYGFRKKY